MKSAKVKLISQGPYSQNRHYDREDVPMLSQERPDAYEKRTWRNRMHATPDGRVEIPGSAFAHSLQTAAKRLRIRIPGKGQSEYTKHFEAGVMVTDGLVLPDKVAEVSGLKLFVPADGKPGGGKRVTKYFPIIREWSGEVTYFIFDDIITEDVFTKVLQTAGLLVGIGRFRPENRGHYGRYAIQSLAWLEEEATLKLVEKTSARPV